MLSVMNNNDHSEGITLAIIKTGPPITVTGMIWLGYSVQDWACTLTCVWVVIQIYLALYNHFKIKVKTSNDK